MTLQNTTKIALLFSVMVLPIAFSNAYADGSAEIVAVCGFDSPSDVPLGLIVYGQDGDENNFSIDVTGNGVGTLELGASDWKAIENTGNHAEKELIVTGSFMAGSYLNFRGVQFTAHDDAMVGPQIFDIRDKTLSEITDEVVSKINAHPSVNDFVYAEKTSAQYFKIIANDPGPEGNQNYMSWGTGFASAVGSEGPNLAGGTDLFENVLPAETTRYNVTTDGTPSDGSTYIAKPALAPAGQNVILTTEAFRDNPINLTFQLTGIDVLDDVDYTGAIQQTWTFTYSCTE